MTLVIFELYDLANQALIEAAFGVLGQGPYRCKVVGGCVPQLLAFYE